MQCVANPQLHVSSRVGVTDPMLQTIIPGWVPGASLPHLAGSLGRSWHDGSDSKSSRHRVTVEHYTYPGLGSACQCGGSSSRSIVRFCNALLPVHFAAPKKGGHATGLRTQDCLVQIARLEPNARIVPQGRKLRAQEVWSCSEAQAQASAQLFGRCLSTDTGTRVVFGEF